MKGDSLREKLDRREAVVGCFTRYPSSTLTEFLALLGWDFLVLDGEHGSIDLGDQADLCRACELHGVAAVTRVRSATDLMIGPSLDAGSKGIHLPGINSSVELANAIEMIRFPPLGTRGLAGTRASGFASGEDLGVYTVNANRDLLSVVQVETADAVNQIEELVAIEGADVFFLGPTDLSASLGHPGLPTHPDVTEAMRHVTSVVTASGKHLGVFVSNAESAQIWLRRGARYLATSLDILLSASVIDFFSAVRDNRV